MTSLIYSKVYKCGSSKLWHTWTLLRNHEDNKTMTAYLKGSIAYLNINTQSYTNTVYNTVFIYCQVCGISNFYFNVEKILPLIFIQKLQWIWIRSGLITFVARWWVLVTTQQECIFECRYLFYKNLLCRCNASFLWRPWTCVALMSYSHLLYDILRSYLNFALGIGFT